MLSKSLSPRSATAGLATPHTPDRELVALAATLACEALAKAQSRVQQGIALGWRNVPSSPARAVYDTGGDELAISFTRTRDGVHLAGRVVTVESATPELVVVTEDGVRRQFAVDVTDDAVYVNGLRLKKSDSEYEVVKVTKIGPPPPKKEKAEEKKQ